MEKYIDLSGGVRGTALMKIDLSLSEQLVCFICLCSNKAWGGCVCEEGASLIRLCSSPHTVHEALGVQARLQLYVLRGRDKIALHSPLLVFLKFALILPLP